MSEPEPISAADFRRTLSRFASGITVITGMDGTEPVGFACQAFTAVSLDPPLVLFCADHRGRAWPRIQRSGRFCVNVLAAHQIAVCERFGARRDDRFQGLAWDESRWGCPALPDVLARVHADIDGIHTTGDHDVVIGRVRELEELESGAPLVFFRGGFSLEAPADSLADAISDWDWS